MRTYTLCICTYLSLSLYIYIYTYMKKVLSSQTRFLESTQELQEATRKAVQELQQVGVGWVWGAGWGLGGGWAVGVLGVGWPWGGFGGDLQDSPGPVEQHRSICTDLREFANVTMARRFLGKFAGEVWEVRPPCRPMRSCPAACRSSRARSPGKRTSRIWIRKGENRSKWHRPDPDRDAPHATGRVWHSYLNNQVTHGRVTCQDHGRGLNTLRKACLVCHPAFRSSMYFQKWGGWGTASGCFGWAVRLFSHEPFESAL